jgi:hypothetical protein
VFATDLPCCHLNVRFACAKSMFNPGSGSAILTATSTAPTIIQNGEIPGDGFVLAISPYTDDVRLAKAFGTAGHGTGVGLDSAGNLVLAGTFTGVANLGDGSLNASAGTSVLLAKFKPDGSVLWNRAWPHPSEETLQPLLAVEADESSWLGGFTGAWPLDFGSGPVNTSATPRVGFLAHFAP